MTVDSESPQPSRIVVVVGVDLSDVSEHLVAQTRALIRPAEEAEVHVVHVVRPDPLRQRLVRPLHSQDIGARSHVEYATWDLQRLCRGLEGPRTRVLVHTPIGSTADELTRVAAQTGADILIVEAHDHDQGGPRRVFHRSVVARIARTAPCTVLTIRRPPGHVADAGAKAPLQSTTAWSASP